MFPRMARCNRQRKQRTYFSISLKAISRNFDNTSPLYNVEETEITKAPELIKKPNMLNNLSTSSSTQWKSVTKPTDTSQPNLDSSATTVDLVGFMKHA
ncbi:hypothetical protein DICVIV_04054 [Dictyocaulus viviparus]|uniref:Uncharacterized protein n=1 Tax=Dictyocaulus viviparus TaxID=29172 RepID=A0A0D8Y5G9_DICVI|nr:hypothetical protein DICVIV_04054 [Dictyocaulus viviparus]